ncbi:MAG: DUF2200 family protein [Flavobacteriales bacterium]|nr:DUF2200 family protein [Flavobacteriales bacterium]
MSSRSISCSFIQNLRDDLFQKIRSLDKLEDELAKGKKMESILRK